MVVDNLVTDPLGGAYRCAFYEGDIADDGLIDRICGEQGIAPSCISRAGGVPESVSNPLKYYHNTLKSRALIESAVRNKVSHFIFSSTAAVYGVPDRTPVAEDFPTVPINPYGASKLMTEVMLRDCAAAYPLNYGALRYFNVAGADPQGRTGQSTKDATHLIKVAVEAALGKRGASSVMGTDYPTPMAPACATISMSPTTEAHAGVMPADRGAGREPALQLRP